MPEDMPEDMSEYMPEDMSDRMPEDMSEYMPEDMPDRMPEDMSDRVPEDMPDRMPEDLPDRMPEDMPDHMPEDMPDRMSNRMSEDMSDRMPEDLPARKCINVMVGITRSKVICFFIRSTRWRLTQFDAIRERTRLVVVIRSCWIFATNSATARNTSSNHLRLQKLIRLPLATNTIKPPEETK